MIEFSLESQRASIFQRQHVRSTCFPLKNLNCWMFSELQVPQNYMHAFLLDCRADQLTPIAGNRKLSISSSTQPGLWAYSEPHAKSTSAVEEFSLISSDFRLDSME